MFFHFTHIVTRDRTAEIIFMSFTVRFDRFAILSKNNYTLFLSILNSEEVISSEPDFQLIFCCFSRKQAIFLLL